MMKWQTTCITLLLLLAVIPFGHPVYAAKKRVRTTTVAARAPGVAYSSVRLSRATNSVVLTFLNLNRASKASYLLNYTGSGLPQGIGGALVPSGQTTDSHDLYFGTCSKGDCTPHRNITNATLTVTTTLSSGGTYIKRYRIRI